MTKFLMILYLPLFIQKSAGKRQTFLFFSSSNSTFIETNGRQSLNVEFFGRGERNRVDRRKMQRQ